MYKVLANSITGVHGKHLLKDKQYPATDFLHLAAHIANGHVEEVKTEEPVKEATPTKKSK